MNSQVTRINSQKRILYSIISFAILLSLGSCSSIKSGNFNKQKYLQGQLTPVYSVKNEVIESKKTDSSPSKSTHYSVDTIFLEPGFDVENDIEYSEGIPDQSPVKGRLNRKLSSMDTKFKEKFVALKKTSYKADKGSKQSNFRAMTASCIMLALSMLSLLLFYSIGWWAYAFVGGFFILAMIFMAWIEIENDWLGIGKTILYGPICLGLIIALPTIIISFLLTYF